ncbi:GtrA family protein [Tabrizicola aquatica]|uniref:GtrA family protein n=1 Tax=Tabrizicola aquatica TaxID=909926 RepID=UPI0015E16A2B|nr:GtrA family protein [Tabrizicola aquatica]
MLAQILRFGGVGGVATLAHVLAALAAGLVLQLSPQQANLAGFLTAVLVSYFGHANYTFQAGRGASGQFLRFAVVALAGYAASSLTVALVTQALGLPFGLAMAAVAVVVPASSFLAMRSWVFAGREATAPFTSRDLALCAMLGLGVVLLFWDRPVNHDVAWYLIAARAWQGGAELYIDLMEVNPPLNFYLTLPALWIADATGFAEGNAHYIATGLLVLVSLLWSASVLREDTTLPPARRMLILLAALVAILLPGLNGWGQRDQIMVLFLLPWALNEGMPVRAKRGRTIAAAAFAAVGICLKPYFVVLPLAVTVLNCVERRSLRPVLSPANWTFLLAGLAYIAFVSVAHPAYFTEMVGVAVQVYGAYGKPLTSVLSDILPALSLVLVAVLVSLRCGGLSRPVRVLLTLALGGLATYLLQGTGFGYHKVPFLAFAGLACGYALAQSTRPRIDLVLSGLTSVVLLVHAAEPSFYRTRARTEILGVVQKLGPVDGVMTLGSHVYAGPPIALTLGTSWASTYPAQWLVPGAVNRLAITDCGTDPQLCESLARTLSRNRSDIIRDMIRAQPELLLVDLRSGYFREAGFDWLAFMAEDPAWLPVLDDYRQIAETGRFLYFLRQTEKTPP